MRLHRRGHISDDRGMATSRSTLQPRAERLPPTAYFLTSAVFHYFGPSLAVLLFVHVSALGVAWLRIVSAAIFFAAWRRPWSLLRRPGPERNLILALGTVLALMNICFYLAAARLPLSTVGAIEFVGPIALAVVGLRAPRNLAALGLTVGGVAVLTDVRLAGAPVGFLFAFANCAGFVLYVLLGHRAARIDGNRFDRLAAAMVGAAVVGSPVGVGDGGRAFVHPLWLLWAVGVGLCSSVIPYVSDQLAMARLPRATYSLLLALLPATALVMGLIVLGQVPTIADLAGVALVIIGVAVHRPEEG